MEFLTTESLAPWHFWRQGIRSMILLGAREVRAAWRTPAYLIPNLIVPVFFYFVMTGSLEEFANGFGIDNWAGFQLPVSIVFAVQGGSAGMNMVTDIESGYFDKLLVTPASRVAILLGAMFADFVRVMLQASLVILVAEATGLEFATGATGAILLILISSLWGLGYSAIGFAIALKTGNPQATQSMWFLFMPFLFLTTIFAPKEALSGWLEVVATINPMTYVLQSTRSLSMEGWNVSDIGIGLLAVGGLSSITLTLAFYALKSRLR